MLLQNKQVNLLFIFITKNLYIGIVVNEPLCGINLAVRCTRSTARRILYV